jgi:hypothetical protein
MGGILMEQVPGGSNRCPSTAAFAWFGKGVCRLLLLGLPFGTLLGPEATGSGPRFAGAGVWLFRFSCALSRVAPSGVAGGV